MTLSHGHITESGLTDVPVQLDTIIAMSGQDLAGQLVYPAARDVAGVFFVWMEPTWKRF